MTPTHRIFDHVLFALLLLVPLVEWRWSWPRFLRRLASGEPGIRLLYFRNLIIGEWLPALVLIAMWAKWHRPWWSIWLSQVTPARLWFGLAWAVLMVGLLVVQRVMILRRPRAIDRVRATLRYAEPLLPHTSGERRAFWAVSATAGACEEIFYRGFLTWYLAVWTGLVPAVILSALIFGMGHIYLGPMQVPKTALLGLIFSGVVLASGSLWPAVLLHAAMDWNSGELGYRILTMPGGPAERGQR